MAQPVMCPPVPTPVIKASTPLGKSAAISSAVVRAWTSMLAGFSNCCGIHAPGVEATISWARAIDPFMPFSRGVSSKVAPYASISRRRSMLMLSGITSTSL